MQTGSIKLLFFCGKLKADSEFPESDFLRCLFGKTWISVVLSVYVIQEENSSKCDS